MQITVANSVTGIVDAVKFDGACEIYGIAWHPADTNSSLEIWDVDDTDNATAFNKLFSAGGTNSTISVPIKVNSGIYIKTIAATDCVVIYADRALGITS